MSDVIYANLYDYPKYYDLLFGSDWKPEFDFLTGCFEKHSRRKVRRVFEPACGTGRLLIKFAQAGCEVGGNDLNPQAVAYCNARLVRYGFSPSVFVGDMADFRVRKRFDAAFNMINSFRHLGSDAAAAAHLRCMADALHAGGLYVLGLHLTPVRGPYTDEESWSARRGHLSINSHMWLKRRDKAGRNEKLGLLFDVYTPTRHVRIEDEMDYRTYSADQFDALLKSVGAFEIAETYDFAYRLGQPIQISSRTEDVVYVLCKR
jgi:SAM-dependent methyltransferase